MSLLVHSVSDVLDHHPVFHFTTHHTLLHKDIVKDGVFYGRYWVSLVTL
jgi:hypothetical protein